MIGARRLREDSARMGRKDSGFASCDDPKGKQGGPEPRESVRLSEQFSY